MFRKVLPHGRLQYSIESFDNASLGLLVMGGEVMDALLLQHTLNGTVQEFETCIGLQHHWPNVCEHTFQRCRLLVLQRNTPGDIREYVDHHE